MRTILTLDLGTTYFKVALFDEMGQLCALHRAAPPISRPWPQTWELSAESFHKCITDALDRLRETAPNAFADVAAITFATQTNSFLLLDAADRPLTPIILWPDTRAGDFADEMAARSVLPGFRRATGVPLLHPEFMPGKLLWLKRHEPDLWRAVRRLCSISDYLTLWMTGQHVSEAGAAGLTGMIDIHALRWLPDFPQHLGLRPGCFADILRAGASLGRIRRPLADTLGISPDTTFVVGCLDQYAGAIGAGNIFPGGISETTGTVLATVRCSSSFDANAPAAVYQGPAFDEGVYYQMAFGTTSANLLEAYCESLPDRPAFEDLVREAADTSASDNPLRLINATPSDLFERLAAISPAPSRAQITRAILEAVACALRDQVRTLCADELPKEIRCAGGAARSEAWLQIKADILGIPTVTLTCPEPTSLGAAMLAARAMGWSDLPALANSWVRTRPAHQPAPSPRDRSACDSITPALHG